MLVDAGSATSKLEQETNEKEANSDKKHIKKPQTRDWGGRNSTVNITELLVKTLRWPKTCHSPPSALLEAGWGCWPQDPELGGVEHGTREKGQKEMRSFRNNFNCVINEACLYSFDILEYVRALIVLWINSLLHI